MKIRKHLLSSILISTIVLTALPTYSAMTPEASMLYQQACSAEHQQDLKGAIENKGSENN